MPMQPDAFQAADLSALGQLDREDLVRMIGQLVNGGVFVNFYGKRSALEIAKKVRPRVTRRLKEFHVGSPDEQADNLLVEGENLQAMVTLYKYRGQVDLVLTDPPYNTGNQFRYNDRWDEDPNDPDLGQLVTLEDGSRHTKWMKALMPRLHMMRSMLKPSGVLAVCIDDNELFHLGMMLDEVFGEENRLAVINWQKTTSKNDARHVANVTEYVLVYARDLVQARTGLLPASEKAAARFGSLDGDVRAWKQGDASAREWREATSYGIQSPFTGEIHYPSDTRHWANTRAQVKQWLEEWGSSYEERDIHDDCSRALVIKSAPAGKTRGRPEILERSKKQAAARLRQGSWPRLYFGADGTSRPMFKVYEDEVRNGSVPLTFWHEQDFTPYELGCVSWGHAATGRSREGTEEFRAVVGADYVFETVKPLKLFRKLIQLWCPENGLVLDPYAGSGTTGHAVLELNHETGGRRRFILIEQGRPDQGDKYARTLTHHRLRNAITGQRPDDKGRLRKTASPLGGGFEFRALTQQIDAKTVMSMKRDELIDVVITSHWENDTRNGPNLVRIEDPAYTYLVGRNSHNQGYFLIWTGDGPVGQLDVNTYRDVLAEGKRAGLATPYHVYARYEIYQSRNVVFYKIPDRILAHLGLSEASDAYNDAGAEEA